VLQGLAAARSYVTPTRHSKAGQQGKRLQSGCSRAKALRCSSTQTGVVGLQLFELVQHGEEEAARGADAVPLSPVPSGCSRLAGTTRRNRQEQLKRADVSLVSPCPADNLDHIISGGWASAQPQSWADRRAASSRNGML
jgi:hypothetical protein